MALTMVLGLAACDGGSAGIIGGQDGPTTIFTTVGGNNSEEPSSEPTGDDEVQNNDQQNGEDEEVQNPQVTITMENGGKIVVELYPDIAPNTVNNFISLVKQGYYDGVIFHRVIKGFMIQGGSPDGTGSGGPGYSIKGEFTSNGFQNDLLHTPGVLSMARTSVPDSAGSQFFLMTSNSPHLDGQYAAFGKVIEGMDIVYAIEDVKTDMYDRPTTEQKVASMTVDTFGVEYPEPEVIEK